MITYVLLVQFCDYSLYVFICVRLVEAMQGVSKIYSYMPYRLKGCMGMKVQGLAFIMCNVCNVSLVHSVAVVHVAPSLFSAALL